MRSFRYKIGARILRVELSEKLDTPLEQARVIEEGPDGEHELLSLSSCLALHRGRRIDILGAGERLSGIAAFPGPSSGEVCVEGLRYLVQDADLAQEAEIGETETSGPDVRAPMPGRVAKLLVEPGATVDRGTPLLILESMKMETEITAGVPGTVGAIAVCLGQNVNPGELLVEIRPQTRP